ncbi:MAG: cytochrome c [Acidobacteria bacterium]|nr:cytochrome c [Acidobacteriota bacterium]
MRFSIRQMQLLVFAFSLIFGGWLMLAQPPATQAVFEDNVTTFKTKCAMCHGMDGTGNTPTGKSLKVRDLGSAEVQKQSDAQLNTIISKGKDKMPGFNSSLNAEQIKGLVAHIRSLKK